MRRVALGALLIAVLLPSAALARRRATKQQRAGVVAAALRASDIGKQQALCVVVFVSTVSKRWALLAFPNKPSQACLRYQANGVSFYHRKNGRWHWITAGSDLRCPIKGVPTRVAQDLKVC
jgi:hypothetical protein